jgi:hypothetical protein
MAFVMLGSRSARRWWHRLRDRFRVQKVVTYETHQLDHANARDIASKFDCYISSVTYPLQLLIVRRATHPIPGHDIEIAGPGDWFIRCSDGTDICIRSRPQQTTVKGGVDADVPKRVR